MKGLHLTTFLQVTDIINKNERLGYFKPFIPPRRLFSRAGPGLRGGVDDTHAFETLTRAKPGWGCRSIAARSTPRGSRPPRAPEPALSPHCSAPQRLHRLLTSGIKRA